MKSRSIFATLFISAAAAAAGMANADATFHTAGNEAGVVTHAVPGTLTVAQARAANVQGRVGGDAQWQWTNEATGHELRQHAYAFRNGRLVHADDISHNSPRPRLSADDVKAAGIAYPGS